MKLRQVAEHADETRDAVLAAPRILERVALDAARMGEEVAQGQFGGDVRVGDAEIGKPSPDRLVEREFAGSRLPDQHGDVPRTCYCSSVAALPSTAAQLALTTVRVRSAAHPAPQEVNR